MPVLHLLGTGAGLADAGRTTTMLAFASGGSTLVVDCGGDVVQRLLVAGLDLDGVDALIVTHEHPDHVAGFPLFMVKIWLAGRRRPIAVHGIRPAIDQARRVWEAFETGGWTGVPEIQWREVALEEGAVVLDDGRWKVTAAPGDHSVPVIGLRVHAADGGGTIAYSCDTERSDAITRLARGADLLVHEATGDYDGHCTAEDAARAAAGAGAKRLVLVHLAPGADDYDLTEARRIFPATELGTDGGRYEP